MKIKDFLGILVIIVCIAGLFLVAQANINNQDHYQIPQEYINKMDESQKRIEDLEKDLEETRLIKELIKQNYEKDSVNIVNSSDREIDSMFNELLNSFGP